MMTKPFHVIRLTWRLVCLLALMTVQMLPSHAQQTLRIMSFGGSFQDAQRAAQFQPFEQATGIKIVESTWFADLGKIRAMVEAGNVTADLVLGDVAHAIAGCNEGFSGTILDLNASGDPNDYLPGTMKNAQFRPELVSIYVPLHSKGERFRPHGAAIARRRSPICSIPRNSRASVPSPFARSVEPD